MASGCISRQTLRVVRGLKGDTILVSLGFGWVEFRRPLYLLRLLDEKHSPATSCRSTAHQEPVRSLLVVRIQDPTCPDCRIEVAAPSR